ncbi:MAG: Maf family protein [Candidatus Micrarchaeia archaeon]
MPLETIFATSSPQRKSICRRHGIRCSFRSSNASEAAKGRSARHVAISNAMKKARKCLRRRQDAIVIGADTVVSFRGKIIGKPKSKGEARRIISALAGKSHRVITGVCMLHAGMEKCYSDCSSVKFRGLSRQGVEKFVASGSWKGKAGGYGVQSDSRELIASVGGSRENVEGLDGKRLKKELKAFIARIGRA